MADAAPRSASSRTPWLLGLGLAALGALFWVARTGGAPEIASWLPTPLCHAAGLSARPSFSLVSALLLGFAGSLSHCVGMCGGFVATFAVTGEGGKRREALDQAFYHGGRLAMYGGLGAIAGALGGSVALAGRLAGLQEAIALVAGVLLLLMGLRALLGFRLEGEVPGWSGSVRKLFRWAFRPDRPLRALWIGLANGLMPCGLIASGLAVALASADPLKGALDLVAFGLGTVPAMAAWGVGVRRLGAATRGAVPRLGGLVMLVAGVLAVLRGLLAT